MVNGWGDAKIFKHFHLNLIHLVVFAFIAEGSASAQLPSGWELVPESQPTMASKLSLPPTKVEEVSAEYDRRPLSAVYIDFLNRNCNFGNQSGVEGGERIGFADWNGFVRHFREFDPNSNRSFGFIAEVILFDGFKYIRTDSKVITFEVRHVDRDGVSRAWEFYCLDNGLSRSFIAGLAAAYDANRSPAREWLAGRTQEQVRHAVLSQVEQVQRDATAADARRREQERQAAEARRREEAARKAEEERIRREEAEYREKAKKLEAARVQRDYEERSSLLDEAAFGQAMDAVDRLASAGPDSEDEKKIRWYCSYYWEYRAETVGVPQVGGSSPEYVIVQSQIYDLPVGHTDWETEAWTALGRQKALEIGLQVRRGMYEYINDGEASVLQRCNDESFAQSRDFLRDYQKNLRRIRQSGEKPGIELQDGRMVHFD